MISETQLGVQSAEVGADSTFGGGGGAAICILQGLPVLPYSEADCQESWKTCGLKQKCGSHGSRSLGTHD